MKYLLVFIWILFIPGVAMAQNIVAIYTPGLDFADGNARNQYVNKIAQILSDKTDMTWQGRSYARASDFESERSSVDVAILDADYYSSKSSGFQPVAMLSANGQTKRPLKVISRKGSSNKLYQYQNKRFTIAALSSQTLAFIESSPLGHETKATDYFSVVDDARDTRAAINAVEMGNADITMVFEGYDHGFTTIYTTPPVGLPVIAVNTGRLSGNRLQSVKSALKDISVKTSSFITGTADYDESSANAYKKIAQSSRGTSIPFQPAEPESYKFKPSSTALRPDSSGLELSPSQVDFAPSLYEIDLILERNL